jgi:hypothetical protein
MANNTSVPEIFVTGNTVYSNSPYPKNVADTGACWSVKSRAAAKKLLNTDQGVYCQDAGSR